MKLPKKILLLGYMASGKSLIGSELSKHIDREFIDLDLYISDKEKLSIPEIFDKKGEEYFREIEFNYLEELLNSDKVFVLSVGGGTSCSEKAMKLITKKTVSIYLNADANALYDRLLPKETERPLLANISHGFLIDYIYNHLAERAPFYSQAKIEISVDNKAPKEIVADIIRELK